MSVYLKDSYDEHPDNVGNRRGELVREGTGDHEGFALVDFTKNGGRKHWVPTSALEEVEQQPQWSIVITSPDEVRPTVVGPFDSEADAVFHEDRYLDLPAGAQAWFVPMQSAADLKETAKA